MEDKLKELLQDEDYQMIVQAINRIEEKRAENEQAN